MIRSSLSNHVQSPLNDEDRHKAACRLWHEHRKIVLYVDDADIDWAQRQWLINLGNERYGKGPHDKKY